MDDGPAASSRDVETRRKFWEIRDMKGYGRYWRVTSMGNTGISRGMGNKGKSPSQLLISFPTKKLPPTLPHQGPDTSYSYVSPRSLPNTDWIGLDWIMFFGPKAQRWDQQGHSAPKKRKKKK